MKVRQAHGDAIIGLILSGLGMWWLWMAWDLGMGTVQEPGPGFFPAAIAIALTVGGLGCTLRAIRLADAGTPVSWIDPTAAKAVGLILLLCAGFVTAGFLLSSVLFLAAMLYLLGGVGFLRSCTMAAVITFVFWLVFEHILSLQLPSGFLFAT